MTDEEFERIVKAFEKHKMRIVEGGFGGVVYACSCGEVRATIGRHVRDILEETKSP